jgi:hypothetical protein
MITLSSQPLKLNTEKKVWEFRENNSTVRRAVWWQKQNTKLDLNFERREFFEIKMQTWATLSLVNPVKVSKRPVQLCLIWRRLPRVTPTNSLPNWNHLSHSKCPHNLFNWRHKCPFSLSAGLKTSLNISFFKQRRHHFLQVFSMR